MSVAESDRELLELAAKAAGYTTKSLRNVDRMKYDPQVIALVVHKDGELVSSVWDPLNEDGPALRLAVACKLLIDTDHCCAMPINRTGESEGDWSDGMLDDDRGAATRLAIVRAAAEIGRAM